MADLDRARDDLGAFAAMIGCPLEPWQARSLDLETRITAIVAPRQSGKSRSLAVLALWSAFRRPGVKVLIVSASEDGSRRLLAECRRIAAASPLLRGSLVDEQAGLLTLTNGSEIRSVPASERAVRGWSVDVLLLDEAALQSEDVLVGAAIPTTAARPDARIVAASSALRASGAFFDYVTIGDRGSEHIRSSHWRLADCHWISPSAIESARATMSPLRFRAEYEGEFAGSADALFTREALDRATAEYRTYELDALPGPGRIAAGTDLGAGLGQDRTTIVGLGGVEGGRFAVVLAHHWPPGVPLHKCVDDVIASPAHFAAVACERNGLGEAIAGADGLLWRKLAERSAETGGARRRDRMVVIEEGSQPIAPPRPRASREDLPGFTTVPFPFFTTAESKGAVYGSLRLLIEDDRLALPASAEELRRELDLLKVDLTPGGTERIEASRGHDDLADALGASLLPHKDRRGRWRTVIAAAADPRRDAVGSENRPAPLATVQTPGGIEIPVGAAGRPIFRSIARDEWTVPPGTDETRRAEKSKRGDAEIRAARKELTTHA